MQKISLILIVFIIMLIISTLLLSNNDKTYKNDLGDTSVSLYEKNKLVCSSGYELNPQTKNCEGRIVIY